MYFYSGNFRGHVRFESAGLFQSAGPWQHPARTLPSYELILVTDGSFPLQIGDTDRDYHSGECLVLPPRTPHAGVRPLTEPVQFFWFHFQTREFTAIDTLGELMTRYEACDPNRVIILPDHSNQFNMHGLYNMCNHLIHINEDHASPLYLNTYTSAILYEISHQMLRVLTEKENTSAKLQPIQSWIHAHACEHITLERIAREFEFHPSYLSRRYKEEMGISIVDQITAFRLERAKWLLASSSRTIQEIAYEVGYNDPRYFMRIFKRRELVTPSEYRHTFFQRHFN